ncbi:MAG TPA: hypothetical protein VJR89_27580, partial [Polyangiales bacterium]|nr:hypothetical protein [Polyangiales bacterium]
ADMPASARDALRERLGQLSPLARRLAEAQALALDDTFTRDDYALLAPDAETGALDDALDELVTQRLLDFDIGEYRFADRTLQNELCDALDDASRRERYAALAARGARTGEHQFAVGRFWLLSGEEARGVELLVSFVRGARDRVEFVDASRMPADEAGRTLALALQACERLGRPAREAYDLRHWITMLSVAADDALYWQAAPAWRAQLERDSGLCDYWQLSEITDPNQRLMRALTLAAERYAATPEAERVYAPDHAIRLLVHYVVLSIAVGSRTFDCALVASLPGLLEPLAALSPLIDAIWQNALATQESTHYRRTERANQRWIDVYERLGKTDTQDPQIVRAIRYAIAYGVGLNEAAMGRDSAMHWAEKLDEDPMQHVNAMYLRKVVRLQQGDLEGAERYRKQAELLALQSSTRQMFTSLLSLEINIHAAAWDLTGLKQLAARVEPLAARQPGWVPFQILADAHYQRLLGDYVTADQTYARCLAVCAPDEREPMRPTTAWPAAIAGRCDCLIALGRADEAHALASQALATAEAREMDAAAHEIVRALALAEGKRGDYAGACARLERVLERQRALGVSGLFRGATYEARARIAIWAGDQAAVERYGRLTAEQFRHGRGSTLGARYERLMEEARGAGVLVLPELSPFETTIFGGTELGTRAHASLTVASAMAGATDSRVRAQRALQLLCDVRGAAAGHLYLAVQSELRLVASSSGAPPDDMLQRLVSDFWSQQSDDTDPDTAMLDDDGPPTQVWTDRKGTAFRPILLHGRLDGMPVTAGVVLLSGDAEKTDSESDTTLVTELASFFLRTGDSMRPK